ncbi:MAG: TauD/TfdA family dioxygenase, partial [Thermoanaerobaculia bacterium]
VLATEPGAAQLDLTLALAETPRGLAGWINYSTDLFDDATIDRLARQLAALLERAAGDPEARLDELTRDLDSSERKQLMIESKRRETNLQRFKAVQPKPISLPAREVVRMGPLTPGQRLPLLVTPAVEDVDLAAWAAENRGLVEAKLHEHGAILFRGFGIASPPAFERFAGTICGELFHDNGEHPRETVSGNVYTPVFYPADQRLLWHNENSFNFQWPAKILFCCVQPPESGGETPIVDSRQVFAAIDPRVRDRFVARQVMYVRNFGNGLGLDWRTVFQVEDEAGLAEQCRAERISFEWREEGGLHTRSVRPAAVRHPATGEMSWFNQAQHWHVSCLDPETRRSMEALFREEDLPRNCYLGDSSRIEDREMAEILAAYQRLEVSFPWQRGDVLLVDNVLTAHGRTPFTGERKLLVAMGEMTSFEEV